MTATVPEGNAVFPRSHVGFDSITQQIEKKLLKRGFQFNVICVGVFNSCGDVILLLADIFAIAGQTGLGKSTLINTIFASHLIDSKGRLRPDQEMKKTTEIESKSHSLCFIECESASP
jgi:septin 3/9/12